MGGVLRILQAGVLRLDRPLEGVDSRLSAAHHAEILNAKYQAAQRFFAAAVAEQVEFVLLAGELCSTQEGSRPFWFLQREFQQLAQHGVHVICAEATDHFSWPSYVALPDTVHILTCNQSLKIPETGQFPNLSCPLYVDWKISKSTDRECPPKSECALAGLHVQLWEDNGVIQEVTYRTSERSPLTVRVSPLQAESAEETSLCHGLLIECQSGTEWTQTPVPTASVDWQKLVLLVGDTESFTDVRQRATAEIHRLAEMQSPLSAVQMLTITLQGSPSAKWFSLSPGDQFKLLQDLQHVASHLNTRIWPCRIEREPLNWSGSVQATELPVHLALQELEILQLEDIYENLDLHVLEIDNESFQKTKVRVLKRLPGLLCAARAAGPRVVTQL